MKKKTGSILDPVRISIGVEISNQSTSYHMWQCFFFKINRDGTFMECGKITNF